MRAVPRLDEHGCAFAGPGVDLLGDDVTRVIAATSDVTAWLRAREPGIDLRTLSFDLTKPRVLLTLVPPAGDRPRALRFDPPSAEELVFAAQPATVAIAEACVAALRRR